MRQRPMARAAFRHARRCPEGLTDNAVFINRGRNLGQHERQKAASGGVLRFFALFVPRWAA
jgi:hypothetical protein